MSGGYYKLCYSPDGSMTGNEHLNTIVPIDIRVLGVASDCLGNGGPDGGKMIERKPVKSMMLAVLIFGSLLIF